MADALDFNLEHPDLSGVRIWMPLPHFSGGWSYEHNSEGMFSFDRHQILPPSGYVQLYRNGIVEAVADDVTFFHPNDQMKQHRYLKKSDYRRELLS